MKVIFNGNEKYYCFLACTISWRHSSHSPEVYSYFERGHLLNCSHPMHAPMKNKLMDNITFYSNSNMILFCAISNILHFAQIRTWQHDFVQIRTYYFVQTWYYYIVQFQTWCHLKFKVKISKKSVFTAIASIHIYIYKSVFIAIASIHI